MLRTALCYAVAIQAFLSAFEVTVAAAQMPEPDAWLAICHGVDSNAPSNGNTGNGERLPCVLCALAGAASALLPGPVALAIAPPPPAGLTDLPRTIPFICQPPARAGFSRAPPSFA
jgi:hypothetical protein